MASSGVGHRQSTATDEGDDMLPDKVRVPHKALSRSDLVLLRQDVARDFYAKYEPKEVLGR